MTYNVIACPGKGDNMQITWDNPAELESYINRLQSAADRLTIENRKLRKCHFDIADKVTKSRFISFLFRNHLKCALCKRSVLC